MRFPHLKMNLHVDPDPAAFRAAFAAALQPLAGAPEIRIEVSKIRAGSVVVEAAFVGPQSADWRGAAAVAADPSSHADGVASALLAATHAAIARTMQVPEVEQRLLALGAVPRFSASPAEAAAYLRSEYLRWGEVVRRIGASLD